MNRDQRADMIAHHEYIARIIYGLQLSQERTKDVCMHIFDRSKSTGLCTKCDKLYNHWSHE